jgi:hypothetical protein
VNRVCASDARTYVIQIWCTTKKKFPPHGQPGSTKTRDKLAHNKKLMGRRAGKGDVRGVLVEVEKEQLLPLGRVALVVLQIHMKRLDAGKRCWMALGTCGL